MTKIAGSGSEPGSGSISQRHGSADPDPHQNVMDPDLVRKVAFIYALGYLLNHHESAHTLGKSRSIVLIHVE
jgi:hypothetical protein